MAKQIVRKTAAPPKPHGAFKIGQRSTKQRSAVAAAILDIDDFRSAQEIYDILKSSGDNVGLTTVYRSLQAMAAIGEIDVLVNAEGEALYRRCGQRSGHHHHLVCRTCGFTVEVEGPAVELWTYNIASEQGFVDVTHTLDIFGICASCARRK
ncbi:transcriptional repressor [Actinomycetes bacterium]|nr:transcriptional repressor [Actinomycetes bacterium]